MLRFAFVAVLAATLAGCQTTGASGTADASYSADYRDLVVRNKASFFKDPASIKDAMVAAPTPNMFGWQVCLQANAKNSFGGYTGRQTHIVQIYRNGAPPIMQEPTIYDSCNGYMPFPEIEAGYVPPKPAVAAAPETSPAKRR